MSVTIEIAVEAGAWARHPEVEAAIRRAVEAAAADAALRDAEVGVVLTDDAHMRSLNRTWRSVDKPTNVLSFPAADAPTDTEGPRFVGDIVFALETIEQEALAEAKPVNHHLAHLAVHGMLHLLGFDHEREEEAEAMEARERAVLAGLGVPDPYAPIDQRRTETA